MGDNRGYSIYEEIIIGLYDNDALNQKTLEVVLNPFKNTDMDHGGCCDLRTKDGLTADQVVVKVGNPTAWETYRTKSDTVFGKYGVKTLCELEDLFEIGTPEWREASHLDDDFRDAWQKLTETW